MQCESDQDMDITIHVKGGLRHGQLTVGGLATQQFTPSDLQTGHVTYHHDNSDAVEDRIFFRITNGKHTTRIKVPVQVMPKDDDAPTLIVNDGIDVRQNGFVKITTTMLNAYDKDSPSEDIIYVIKTQPGRIYKYTWHRPQMSNMSNFKQKFLIKSEILLLCVYMESDRGYIEFDVIL